ncbi:hypothetical protein M1116_03925 [Patescibacteria group bacterium]|nr:hypothetical protein [Patescibacteria group bacterium]
MAIKRKKVKGTRKGQSLLIGLALFVIMAALWVGFLYKREGKVEGTSTNQIYWGAYIDGSTYGPGYGTAPWDSNTWNLFEQHAGKRVSIIHWGQPWYMSTSWPYGYYPFVAGLGTTARAHGAIPMIDWGSFDPALGAQQSSFALRNIVNGASYSYGGQTFDNYVTNWAKAAKAWGHPFFLRFDWEMNGWWQFPWATAKDPNTGVTINNNTPADFVAAWQHIHNIFTSVGATNASWVWCPNISSTYSVPLAQLYPGDNYVDWICLDGYNKDVKYWQTFAQVFGGSSYNGYHNSYNEITSLTTKPLMIGEFASDEAGDGGTAKANWITDAFLTQMPNYFPRIKAVVWFNWNSDSGSSYVIESTSTAQNALASAIASSYFATNTFGSLNQSPIPIISVALPTATATPGPTVAVSPTTTPQPQPTLAPTATPTVQPQPITGVTATPTSAKYCCKWNGKKACIKWCQ